MKKNVLLRTNLSVCAVIILGFIVTSLISYQSNQGIFLKDVESVSKLTSEGIYHQIDSIFTKPINISLTMANDSLLKEFLDGEQTHLNNQVFVQTMRDYLNAYRVKYDYDSVFLASAQTKRYYYFNGLDRTLEQEDPENIWFYDFLNRHDEYTINIDNDQVENAENEVTVFINCRIKDSGGETMGIVGVGFRVNSLQSLLRSYEDDFGVNACLISETGNVEISTDRTRYEGEVNLFENCAYPDLKDSILNSEKATQYQWYSSQKGNGYVVSRFIENLGWNLIVENDTTALNHKLTSQLVREILIVSGVILLVLLTITSVIHRYNRQIIELTKAREQAHRTVFQKATEKMYENIYEMDITHNQAASEATAKYFESLGAPPDIGYDKALEVIARKQIKEEYRQGYIDTFSPQNILKAHENGQENLEYDFMITTDGETYYWMRILAHIFYWGDDDSVRILVYRQNIDDEKRRELYLYEQMQRDSLTGLYNKLSTQEHVREMLAAAPEGRFAFFILDIDNFKGANDRLGHVAGDSVLSGFASTLKEQFQQEAIVGRIGGDEFVAFMPVPERESAIEKAEKLIAALRRRVEIETGVWHVTASIGLAVAPESGKDFETLYKKADFALYQAKKNGRDRFVVAETE